MFSRLPTPPPEEKRPQSLFGGIRAALIFAPYSEGGRRYYQNKCQMCDYYFRLIESPFLCICGHLLTFQYLSTDPLPIFQGNAAALVQNHC